MMGLEETVFYLPKANVSSLIQLGLEAALPPSYLQLSVGGEHIFNVNATLSLCFTDSDVHCSVELNYSNSMYEHEMSA